MGILDGKVALVTGAGRGIGREHALMMASEGAKVVVNDLGGDAAGGGADATPAQDVVAEIEAMGGEAVVNGGNVAVFDEAGAMVQQAIDTFGDINIIVNNAGILRDRMLFSMSEDDWDAVIAVHLKGTFAPSHHAAVHWRNHVKGGGEPFGRIINTASPSGIYGNVGQTNYGAAKMGVIGAMNTLVQEGAKYNIRVNALAPTAGTRMTEGLIPEKAFELLTPETVTPAVLFLVGEDAPTRTILAAGAGGFAVSKIVETDGIYLPPEEQTPEAIAANWDAIMSPEGETQPQAGFEQTVKFTGKAAKALGLSLD